MNITKIIKNLGGYVKVAAMTNVYPTTVKYWEKKNSIPEKYHEALKIKKTLKN